MNLAFVYVFRGVAINYLSIGVNALRLKKNSQQIASGFLSVKILSYTNLTLPNYSNPNLKTS